MEAFSGSVRWRQPADGYLGHLCYASGDDVGVWTERLGNIQRSLDSCVIVLRALVKMIVWLSAPVSLHSIVAFLADFGLSIDALLVS